MNKNYHRFRPIFDRYAVLCDVPVDILLAQCETESNFNPNAESPVGAKGLMQFMPGTWEEVGEGDPTEPEQSIKAGAKYDRYLYDRFEEISIPNERWKFALASYNGGRGHINNALRKAREACGISLALPWIEQVQFGGEWTLWDFTKKHLYGCDTKQIVDYVDRIWERREKYRLNNLE